MLFSTSYTSFVFVSQSLLFILVIMGKSTSLIQRRIHGLTTAIVVFGMVSLAMATEVIGLDLSFSCLHGHFKSNTSLFRLRSLRTLNLAFNNFSYSPIPGQFSELVGLTHLNLSQSSFSGQIPTELLQLTKLVSLDLSSPIYLDLFSNTKLSIEKSFLRKLVHNLTNLRELDLSYIDISSEIPQNLLNLSSLRSLNLHECNLFGIVPSGVLGMPSIQSISLAWNRGLRGHLPEFHGNNSLVKLDLSWTSFSGEIPNSIGNLKYLNSLTLGRCDFSGRIPSSIGNLSYLTYLDLTYNNFSGEIPSSIGNLNQLTELWVGGNKLSGNFPLVILNLTHLSFMDLSDNGFTGSLPSNMSALSHLEFFSAGGNSFVGAFPSSLFMIPSLTFIDLRGNQLSGYVDDVHGNISSSSKLEFLYLGGNNSSAPIPTFISRLANLQDLTLSHWNTGGNTVDLSIFSTLNSLVDLDLSYLNTTTTFDLSLFSPLQSLGTLDLSGNSVSTSNITSLSDFPSQLTDLRLSGCNITEFPEFIRTQQNMGQLDLSNNKIQGQVPDWLWRLPYLDTVNLSHNSFSSFQGSSQVFPATILDTIDLSSNAFQGPLFIPSSRSITYLLGSKNNFSGQIPQSICTLRSLEILDLSDNNFNGSLPLCLGNLNNSLSVMNFRGNQLSGRLPDIFSNAYNLRSLDVSHNRLEEKLPKSLMNCTSLEVLNVGSNRIKDMFPFWLKSLQELQVLVLRSNEFHGPISHPKISIGFPKLRIIDISHNHFIRTLPSDYFATWAAMSSVGTNEDGSGSMYMEGTTRYYHDSIVLTNKGLEMELTRILLVYTAIDLSGNKLRGQIPESIGLLKDLRVLNLSNNTFTGHIPTSLAKLTKLESLDMSRNKLSGKIPPELGSLSSLEIVNFSNNQLMGPIPQTTQFQTQDPSSFEDNPGLCGPPLDNSCGGANTPTSQQTDGEEEEEEEEVWSWIAAAIGFAPGLVFGLTIGHIVASYKREWFMKIFGGRKRRSTRTR